MIKNYQKYLINVFFFNFLSICLIFLSLSFILNFLEELKFFENLDVGIYYPLLLTVLNTPSILFDILPFIFLISVKFFFIFLYDRNELEILKNNGINNSKILIILSLISFVLGVLIILFYYTFTSNLKSNYLNLKNTFSTGNDYLAVVNENGLWIKEEINENMNIINAQKFNTDNLEEITITQINIRTKSNRTVIANKADISEKLWTLLEVKIFDEEGATKPFDKLKYQSSFDGETISNLFSNLNSLNIYQLHKLAENYHIIGYSNTDVKVHLNKLYSLPIYFVLMTLIGALIMIKFKFINSKFFVIIFGISLSVIIYYINYFSSLFGSNETVPIHLSVWLPHITILLICTMGIIRINEI